MVGGRKCIQNSEQHSSDVVSETEAASRKHRTDFSKGKQGQMGGCWINKSEMVKKDGKLKREDLKANGKSQE